MTEQAIVKINEEMQKDADNKYLEILGHYVIDRCEDKLCAEKVIKGTLTLKGAFEEIKKKAKKTAKNGCSVMKDREIFDVVDRYFGFSVDDKQRQKSISSVDGVEVSEKTPSVNALDLDFESLI